MVEAFLGDSGTQFLTGRVQLGELLFVLGRLRPRVVFLFFICGGIGLQRGLGLLHCLFARVGSDHDLQDLVFQLADLGLGKLDFVVQRPVLVVGFDLQRLVAVFADLLLLVLDVGLVLAAGDLVGLHRGLGGVGVGFGTGGLGLDLRPLPGPGR